MLLFLGGRLSKPLPSTTRPTIQFIVLSRVFITCVLHGRLIVLSYYEQQSPCCRLWDGNIFSFPGRLLPGPCGPGFVVSVEIGLNPDL